MFTFLEERSRRLLATLTAVAMLAGLSVIGVLAPAQAVPIGTQVIGGSSAWNLKDSWNSYISNAGTIAPAQVAGQSTYGAPTGTFDTTTKTGTLAYPGSVHYFAHGGALDLTISNVEVALSGASGVLRADLSGPAVVGGPKSGVKIADVSVSWLSASQFTLDGLLSAEFGAVEPNFAAYVGQAMSTFKSDVTLAPPLPVGTVTTVVASEASSLAGSPVGFTATVTPEATGTVSFASGSTALGTAPLVDGVATLTTSELSVGTHAIVATYVGSASAETSTSAAVAHTVTPVWTPQIKVFAADGVTPLGNTLVELGDTIVVEGSGFDPASNLAPVGNRPPIAAGNPAGAYVVFGKFADDWRPSGGAAGKARFVGDQKWALSGAALALVPPAYQSAVTGQHAAIAPDGTFKTSLTIQKKIEKTVVVDWPAAGNFGVYTYAAGGTTNDAQEIKVPVNLAGAVAPATSTTTAISAAPATVTAGGTSSLIATVTPAGAAGAVEFLSGSTLLGSVPLAQGAATFPTAALALGEHTFTARFVPSDAGVFAPSATTAGVTVTATAPVDGGGVVTPPANAAGQLVWGVKASFTSYITGGAAAGSIAVSGGAAASGNAFTFSQASKDFNGSTGTVGYAGSVRFTGHAGALDLKLTNPRVKVTGPLTATLLVDVVGKGLTGGSVDSLGVEFASLVLGAPATKDGATTWTNAAATLTAAGSDAFSGFYPAGTALDPVSFSIGADKAPGETPEVPPVAPVAPLAPGVYKNATASTATALPGGEVTVAGTGFGANTTGIELAVYSVRQVIATGLTADANGNVKATVTLPKNLAAGVHTLSFEAPNGVKSQVTITVEAPAAVAKQCLANAVSGATLSWGVKSAFRTYITGPIANGAITTSGVSDSGSVFGWSGGKGSFNTEVDQGRVSFGGSVNFSGHGGILDLTISNVRVHVTGASTGSLIADVSSTDMSGAKSSQAGVVVATLNLSGKKSTSGSTVTWSDVPASLTAAGAKAFAGSYVAGEALDPVTFSFQLGASVECDASSGALAVTGADGLADAALLALAAMTFGLGLMLVARRRRASVQIG